MAHNPHRPRFRPFVEPLEDRVVPAATQLVAIGTGPGTPARVQVFDQLNAGGQLLADFNPFPNFSGGVSVAVGDITGDGLDDLVVGSQTGTTAHVKAYAGVGAGGIHSGINVSTPFADFFAYPGFQGAANVAIGNFNLANDTGSGPTMVRNEIITGAGPGGGPHVKIFDTTPQGPAGTNNVTVDPSTPLVSFFAYSAQFTGGVNVAAGNFDTGASAIGPPAPGTFDGLADELVTSPASGTSPHIRIFRGQYNGAGVFQSLNTTTLLADFFAPFGAGFVGGASVAVGEVDFAGTTGEELFIGAGPGGGPHTFVLTTFNDANGRATGINVGAPLANFFAFDASYTGGVTVGYDVNGGILTGTQSLDALVISHFFPPAGSIVQNFGGGAGLAGSTVGLNVSS